MSPFLVLQILLLMLFLISIQLGEASKLLKLAALAMILRSGGIHPKLIPYQLKHGKGKHFHKEYHSCGDKEHDDWPPFDLDDDEPYEDDHESYENKPAKTYVKPENRRRNRRPEKEHKSASSHHKEEIEPDDSDTYNERPKSNSKRRERERNKSKKPESKPAEPEDDQDETYDDTEPSEINREPPLQYNVPQPKKTIQIPPQTYNEPTQSQEPFYNNWDYPTERYRQWY